MTTQTKTYRVEIRVLGKWHTNPGVLSAVEAAAIRTKYANDPDVRVVPA